MSCNNCSTSGSGNGECPTKASEIIWDGSSLCNGVSPADVVEAIQSVATSLCNLGTAFSGFTADTDNITLINLSSDCFTATDADTLTTWINEAQGYICQLITDVAAINSNSVLIYDYADESIIDEATQTNIKTYSIPANTFITIGDCLHVEIYANNTDDPTDTSARVLILKINSTDVIAQILSRKPSTTKIKWDAYITYGKTGTLDFDSVQMSTLGNGGIGGYKTTTFCHPSLSSLTFTSAIPMLIDGIQAKGTLEVERVRVTKFTKI